MIRKILKYGILIFLTLIAIYIIGFHIKNYRINKNNEIISEYIPKNTYQEKYPISDYVDEGFDTYPFVRKFISASIFEYDSLLDYSSRVKAFSYLVQNFFSTEYNFAKVSSELQYEEENLIELKNNACDNVLENNYNCELKYEGYLGDVSEPISGDVSLFYNGNYDVSHNLVISFLDDDGEISEDEVKLLADDSNSEMLVYLIVEKTQEINQTNMEPDEAATFFYGNGIEQLAGSISYHALVSYILLTEDVENKDIVYERVKEVNITKNDGDDFYVNRSY